MTAGGLDRRDQPQPSSIVGLLRRRVLDAELAALVWLLVEARVPLIVAGHDPGGVGRIALRDALATFLPPGVRRVSIGASGSGLDGLTAADTAETCLVGLDLTPAPVPALQVAFKALARGADLVASTEAGSLEEVFARLRAPDVRLSDDELSFIGLVLVLEAVDRSRDRVVAAHYVRPLARDPGGHLQRLGPAVLATWDRTADRFEDFSWGIATELAARVGLRPGDLDAEVAHRRDVLTGLLGAGVESVADVRLALDGFRLVHRPGSSGRV